MSLRSFSIRPLLLLIAILTSAIVATAQQRYPRVYGSTGRPYGPTQAHYQYERQYGRPWHGYGGQTYSGPRQHHMTLPGAYFPGYYSNPFYGGGYYGGAYYAGVQTFGMRPTVYAPAVAPAPGLTYFGPGYTATYGVYGTPGAYLPYADHDFARNPALGPSPMQNVLQQHQWQQQLQENERLNSPDVAANPVTRPVAPSSTAARLKSIEAQARGDAHLRQQQWRAAYADYQDAVNIAPDRPLAHLRLGLAAVLLQNYSTAAVELKKAVFQDPAIVQTLPRLTDLLGPENRIAQNSMISALTTYTNRDIRDPDRLFLMGVVLTLDEDPRAREFFETGFELAGRGQHFLAFLNADSPASAVDKNQAGTDGLRPTPGLPPVPTHSVVPPSQSLPAAPLPGEIQRPAPESGTHSPELPPSPAPAAISDQANGAAPLRGSEPNGPELIAP